MSDPADSNTLREGEIRDQSGQVCGDFRILRRLGQGGMGQVYLAEQVSLKRKVALKFLKPELSANKTSLERFRREAEAVAKVTHANIVQIYSLGENNGRQFMALEYVDGRNLREFIERKGPTDLRLGLRIITQVASALQQASELGIVHRDIKPENILINRKAEVKVTDFGLSRHFKEDSSLTKSRIAMGTPLYMSPEQVEGLPVDHRSDIYSFGVTCYHIFSGRPPFRGQTPFEVALQHVNKEPAPLAELRPDLPAEVCAMVHKMMAKKPEARYQSGREIVREAAKLRDTLIANGGQPNVTALGELGPVSTMQGVSPTKGAETLTASNTGAAPRRFPWGFAAFLVALVIIGVGVGLLVTPPATVAVPVPNKPAENHTAAPPAAVNELFFAKDREKELHRKIDEAIKNPKDRGLALDQIMDLGAAYLRERKYDEADALFKEIYKPERPQPQPRILSQFGHAMVLAGLDKPAESNKLFIETFDHIDRLEAAATKFEKKDKTAQRTVMLNFWRHNIAWREQMAVALNRNFVNAPDAFPADPRLQALRKPPSPGTK